MKAGAGAGKIMGYNKCTMRSVFIPLALALLFAPPSVCPAASNTQTTSSGASATSGLGVVAASTLPNGMQVIVAPSQAADLVTLDFWVGAGTRRETSQNNGVAHFMEHLLFKGTPTRKPGDIDAAIEDLGGTMNAGTQYDWAHFYVTVGSDDAAKALDILADAVMNASLRQADMDVERQVILSERARELSSPAQRTLQAVNELSFPGHPYGRPLLGSVVNITSMTRQTVLDFYKTYYVPGNTTLVIAGNITPEAGLALAQAAFGAWPARPVPPDKVAPEKPQTQPRAVVLRGGTQQGYVTLGFHAPSVSDTPDAWVMDVLLTWLGQGGNNQLQQDLQRKRKLVSSISANYLTQRDGGLLTVTASFDSSQADAVRDAILDKINDLRQSPRPDGEIRAAKQALLASYLFDAQTNSGRADALGFYNTIDSYKYDTEYIGHVLAVTPAQVQQVAQKYLDTGAYTQATLLPRSDPIEASLR